MYYQEAFIFDVNTQQHGKKLFVCSYILYKVHEYLCLLSLLVLIIVGKHKKTLGGSKLQNIRSCCNIYCNVVVAIYP